MWIVDFGTGMPIEQAALYEAPFEYVRQHVMPNATVHRATYAELGGCMIAALRDMARLRAFEVPGDTARDQASLIRRLRTNAGRQPSHRLCPRRRLLLRPASLIGHTTLGSRDGDPLARSKRVPLHADATFETFPFRPLRPLGRRRRHKRGRRTHRLREGWLPTGLS